MRVNDSNKWEGVAAQLKAYRDQQRATWGDIDDATIGKYLAGQASPEEIAEVKAAAAQYPAVREAIELVREVLEK